MNSADRFLSSCAASEHLLVGHERRRHALDARELPRHLVEYLRRLGVRILQLFLPVQKARATEKFSKFRKEIRPALGMGDRR